MQSAITPIRHTQSNLVSIGPGEAGSGIHCMPRRRQTILLDCGARAGRDDPRPLHGLSDDLHQTNCITLTAMRVMLRPCRGLPSIEFSGWIPLRGPCHLTTAGVPVKRCLSPPAGVPVTDRISIYCAIDEKATFQWSSMSYIFIDVH